MQTFPTLVSALAANCREDRRISFVDQESEQRTLSFDQLRARALTRLGALQRHGLARGDALVLFTGDNERFVELFWACLHGGIVPVPLAAGSAEEHRRKLFRVFAQLPEAWLYADAQSFDRLVGFADAQGLGLQWTRMQERWVAPDRLEPAGAPGEPVEPSPDDIAFIQYSSGSTSDPKGVVLTHRNVTANIASIIEAGGFSDRDVALSWMPLSHDMGLIGFHLNMLSCGINHTIMRTELFARRPLLWLALASRQRATVLCSPNFGYQHYLKQYESRRPQDLDLSAVRLIFNGAEPISAELCERFMRAMAPHGLDPRSMFTVYGLAEASLAVSFPRPGQPVQLAYLDRDALRLGEPVRRLEAGQPRAAAYLKLGTPVPGTEVRIGDARGAPCAEEVVGHVLIRGANVTEGYFSGTASTATARTAEGWLDTGDIGFFCDGQLVITGRAKDIIFVNGQNYYPHDLERIAETVPGVEANKIAAAGFRRRGDATEALALFVLHRSAITDFVPIAKALTAAINQQTGLEVAAVVPVMRIPKTTSGKLQRYALARALEQGEFDAALAELRPLLCGSAPVSAPAQPAATLERLLRICDDLIPEKHVVPETHLLEINLNSLSLARIHEAIDREFSERVELLDLFECPTLAQLAALIDSRPSSTGSGW